MNRKKCLNCGKYCYSSIRLDEIWKCPHCGSIKTEESEEPNQK